MRILIAGANGYIGRRLLSSLKESGHELICCVRDKWRFEQEKGNERIKVLEVNFLDPSHGDAFPEEIDAAYFLIHSMREGEAFQEMEKTVAKEFTRRLSETSCRQVIYLSGIVNEAILSQHLASRLATEKILQSGPIPVTVLRAGIVVGSGSSSFEIIRDIVEKLPFMITPSWVRTKCQPIAIRNVIEFLTGVLLNEAYFNHDYDIGGPEILTYKQMLLDFAAVRQLKRLIITVPVMTPRLSSYWLYFVTSTSYTLAKNLVDSMKVNVVCRPNHLADDLKINLLSYRESVKLAFQKIDQNEVVSSWKDAFSASNTDPAIAAHAEVPNFGCFKDSKTKELQDDGEKVFDNIWHIGGNRGWYYGNVLWKFRGLLDKAFGGVGLNRGRTSLATLHSGDTLDFWRVLVADKANKRLLLYAEMKLPGEAWLEFRVENKGSKTILMQTATFRPIGIWGRVYWYTMLPFHYFIFRGMIDKLAKTDQPA